MFINNKILIGYNTETKPIPKYDKSIKYSHSSKLNKGDWRPLANRPKYDNKKAATRVGCRLQAPLFIYPVI